jgi:hypothetical protein
MKIGTLQLEEHAEIRGAMCVVSPKAAAELLQRNTHNRKVSDRCVVRYAQEMSMGEWLPTAAGVGIDSNGVLTDGQHRLKAVIASGKTVSMLIVTGLPPASQMKQDRHNKRNLAAVFTLAGVCDNFSIVQTAVFLAEGTLSLGRIGKACDTEVRAAIETHKEALTVICKIMCGKIKGVHSVGARAALTMAYEAYPEQAVAFAKALSSEQYMAKRLDDPVFKLKRSLLTHGAHGGAEKLKTYQRTCYAFNAYRKGSFINSVLCAESID